MANKGVNAVTWHAIVKVNVKLESVSGVLVGHVD